MNPKKPNWMVVALNETHYWTEDVVSRAGKVFGLYLFDAHRTVNCCELKPSFELHFIESVATNFLEDEAKRERLEEDLRISDIDSARDSLYVHTDVIDQMVMTSFEVIGHWTRWPDEDYEDELGAVLEHVRCNIHHPRVIWMSAHEPEVLQ